MGLKIWELRFHPFYQGQHRVFQAFVPVPQLLIFGKQRTFPGRDKIGLAEEGSSTVMPSETHLIRFFSPAFE
ncbi:MAG: hypothetical protein CMN56_11825 [Sneathiella sp.]|nr:hypothetical protein [Sneathiella sp.]